MTNENQENRCECPFCNQPLEYEPDMQGMQVVCPSCSKEFQLQENAPVPARPPNVAPPPPTPEAEAKPKKKDPLRGLAFGVAIALILIAPSKDSDMAYRIGQAIGLWLIAGVLPGLIWVFIKILRKPSPSRTLYFIHTGIVVLLGGLLAFSGSPQKQKPDSSIEQVLTESGMDNDLAEPLAEALQSVADKIERNGSISSEEIDEIAESSAEAMRLVVGKPESIPLEKLKEMAERGDVNAQYQLGGNYYSGKGAPKDYEEAVKWCKMAGEQGHPFAHSVLRAIAIDGKAISGEELFAWFKDQAKRGNVKAHFSIGVMYENGETVPRNRQEAMKWLTLAAEQGDSEAKMLLNLMGSGF